MDARTRYRRARRLWRRIVRATDYGARTGRTYDASAAYRVDWATDHTGVRYVIRLLARTPGIPPTASPLAGYPATVDEDNGWAIQYLMYGHF